MLDLVKTANKDLFKDCFLNIDKPKVFTVFFYVYLANGISYMERSTDYSTVKQADSKRSRI